MPGYIHPLSAVGIGSSSGNETSLNLMVNIKRSVPGIGSSYAQNTANSRPVDLKKWFEVYAIAPDFSKGVYTNVAWSEFKNSSIFGATVKIKNESTSQYGNSNNGAIQITPINGSLNSSDPAGTFTATVFNSKGGSSIVSSTSRTTMTFANAPTYFNDGTYYVTITHTPPPGASSPSATFGFYWFCAYGTTGGQLRSDPGNDNSFNNANGTMATVVPTNQGANAGGYSDTVTILCKPKAFVTPGLV